MSQDDPIPTIGMEVHLHLATRTKMFCPCEVRYDAQPNTCVCPVCLGMPGVLPVINAKAVELAVRMALGLNSRIPDFAKWDRKHYYYPDLPKNYQISEYDEPLGLGGHLDVELEGNSFRVGITRVHLEEDAGKLMHAEDGSNYSVVDLNRTGTPLLEVVSEPDIHSAQEARAYGEALRQLAIYLGVGHCNMQLGQMRFEPNISLKIGEAADGSPRYTPITEIKNLNSFRSVERACDFEIRRHRDELAADPEGYTLENLGKSTRGWNDDRGVSFLQRSKEEAHDYRYFPEPDLVPFVPEPEWVEKIRTDMPETPSEKRYKLVTTYKLSAYEADVLTSDPQLSDFSEQVFGHTTEYNTAAGLIMTEGLRFVNERHKPMAELFKAEDVAAVSDMIAFGQISRSTAPHVFFQMVETGKSAALVQTSDAGELEQIVDEVIAENPGPARQFADGVDKAVGRLIGMAKKKTGGKANPKVVRELLIRKLRG